MTIKQREREFVGEEVRKFIKPNIAHTVAVSKTKKIARIIDKEAITKCRLKQIGKWEYGIQHKFEKSDQYNTYEKYREKAHRNGKAGAFHIGDLPMGVTIEKMYFDAYGEGFDGTDVPPMVAEHYECWKCHTKFVMAPAQLPLKCACGTPTPLGRLVEDGYLRR